MRLLVCGDRNWCDAAAIKAQIGTLRPTVVIHGCARGADSLAGEAAVALNIPVAEYPAQWEKFGRAAGPIRNQQMLLEGKPDMVIAFHDDIVNSKGTRDMVRRAEKAGLPVTVFSHSNGNPLDAPEAG